MSDTRTDPRFRRPPMIGRGRRRSATLLVLLAVFVVIVGSGTAASYYVEGLWFASLGYGAVFWRALTIQSAIFTTFAGATFVILYGAFLALKPPDRDVAGVIMVNGRPVALPVGPVLRLIALVAAAMIALGFGSAMMRDWPTLALWWYAKVGPGAAGAAGADAVDPIFGRPPGFYLFTLPAWQAISGWLLTLAMIAAVVALVFFLAGAGARRFYGHFDPDRGGRGLAVTWACVLLVLAVRVYIGRFERLFTEHSIFTGVTYTDAHVDLTGALVVSAALVVGALIALAAAFRSARVPWLLAAAVPAVIAQVAVTIASGYVSSFVVRPNELVRERPYIAHNIAMTRQAFGLDGLAELAFPAETSIEAVEVSRNQATLQNIRLWDWRALQDTLRQIQEIRTYYEFADVDIDRYVIDGQLRQVMLAARELSVRKLPESSRTWINEKLIYTHGYGVTMNPVNGFTPEGLPTLILRDMPVQRAARDVTVTRPEIYFGELTDTDVYVRTRQQEFDYPQGQTNTVTSYEGSGGVRLGGLLRRLVIALDRGDLAKLPFSDDVTADSRLLMRRSVRERVAALAPFLLLDADPYIVISEAGRLFWMIDGFTVSERYPYARAHRVGGLRVNYLRNSVKAVVDAYDGTTHLYVFDDHDPIVSAYRRIFPDLFRDAASMPADLRRHVRYPEMLLAAQADVYALYHMTDPGIFYNREDLWTVANEVAVNDRREQAAAPVEPNFVLMTLPGESRPEFVEILPFTPANRNNLIGWIAGRSDPPHYGRAIIYQFPKTRLVDGPLQIEARIDQNPQLSSQLTLWNQQGSRVRRGSLIVIPIGRALLYAEPIYLQAERSPMPELRIVVLALQERIAYGPTFEAALSGLFGSGLPPSPSTPAAPPPGGGAERPGDLDALIVAAANDLAEYQRLTAEGKLAEAGQRLEHLKQTLDELKTRRR